MNVTSEFLVMAATLLDIKSRMLLPREENEEGDEEDPRDELVKRLLEYKMYKFMSEELKEKSRQAGLSYFREQDLPEEVRSYVPPLNYEELIGDRTAQSLRNVFADVMKRRKSRVDPIRSGFGKIHREEISVADKTLYIRAYLQSHPHADFREMLELQDSKEEIIVTRSASHRRRLSGRSLSIWRIPMNLRRRHCLRSRRKDRRSWNHIRLRYRTSRKRSLNRYCRRV